MKTQDRFSRRAWRQHTIFLTQYGLHAQKEGSLHRKFCVFLLRAVKTSRSARAVVQSQNDAISAETLTGKDDKTSPAGPLLQLLVHRSQ